MEAAPRSWQFSLSNMSVTRKVGIVLLLPVLLASAFAGLRIKDELGVISKLDAATEQARILRPMLEFGEATEQLAIAAVNARPEDPIDSVAAKFDQAAIDLETALRTKKSDDGTTKELPAAIAVARTMRNGLRTSSPATIGGQVDEVGTRIITAISVSSSIEEIVIQRYFLQLGLIANASRLLTQEQIMSATAGGGNPAALAGMLTTLGAEMMLTYSYPQMSPSSATNAQVLTDAVQTRIGALSQNPNSLGNNPVITDSLRTSSDAYRQATTALLGTIDSKLADRTIELRSAVLRDVAIVITTLLAGLALALAVARSLVVPIRRLRHDALQVAHVDLPNEIEVVRTGGATPKITPVDIRTTEEIGQLARAVDDIHQASLHLAAEQARLRVQIGSMFETLSRRSQSLVEQQLALIEDLEHDEDNTERLQSLFRLDHLATRMRRNGDNLLVLAGTALRRGQLHPVQLSDMLWSAVSQVEDYQRVEIGAVPDGIVAGEPAIDIEHLLAELIDNALRYSPPTTPVTLSVSRAVDGGYLIEIIDRGLGMSTEDLRAINDRLSSGGEVTVETARRMGLFVVGRLAKRHTITASLRRTSTTAQQPGVTASVHLPGALVAPPLDATDPTGKPLELTGDYDLPAQPRTLVPVPSLPQHTSPRFEVSSSGLPQRRPAIRVAEPPGQPAVSVPTRTNTPDTDSDAQPPTQPWSINTPTDDRSPFGPPTVGVSAPIRVADAEPERPAGLWAEPEPESPQRESSERESSQREPEPELTVPQQRVPREPQQRESEPHKAGPSAEREPARTTSRSGLPMRRPAAVPEPAPTPTPAPAPERTPEPATVTSSRLQPVAGASPTPIYQRMVSEWLVEPATSQAAESTWTSPADVGWTAAEEATHPTPTGRTSGGLPIRTPGAQLVPGGLAQADESGARDPEEIRNNLTRHLSGVRSGRANAQYDDGGLA
ncbi:sensor histidine kinase [Nocardia sp. CS682]|uniref:HAMP domain-containing sensor histidine kinase n=1 Tax=Nocardia sp. CS682 TaxID=1047172 RepID=UPI00107567B0|nr:sensor histidine kinase [Nocardia sp. CS682]QBS41462.1 ATP-binding protein [Nocardia sp. CS682]